MVYLKRTYGIGRCGLLLFLKKEQQAMLEKYFKEKYTSGMKCELVNEKFLTMKTVVRHSFESFLTKWAAFPCHMEKEWQDFKTKHGKKYEPEEDEDRRKIFMRNMKYIMTHNAAYERGEVSSKLAMNRFGDMTDEELGRCQYGAGSNMGGIKKESVSGTTSNSTANVDVSGEVDRMNKLSGNWPHLSHIPRWTVVLPTSRPSDLSKILLLFAARTLLWSNSAICHLQACSSGSPRELIILFGTKIVATGVELKPTYFLFYWFN